MSAAENKQLLQHIYAELAKGNAAPYVEAMADDFTWIMPGSSSWSGIYAGKQAVIAGLFPALRNEMEGRIKQIPHRFIADEDHVVVEARGDNVTKRGQPYRNTYCLVYRLEGGKLKEVIEYMDTQLVAKVLNPPQFPGGKEVRQAS